MPAVSPRPPVLLSRTWHVPVSAVILAMCVSAGGALASTLTAASFSFDGGPLGLTATGSQASPYARWNPRRTTDNADVFDQGLHISFFGHPPSCNADAANGPVGPLDPSQTALLGAADLPMVPRQGATTWSPEPDPAQCPGAQSKSAGPAFIAAPAKGTGHLQLLTFVKPATPAGKALFWGPFAPSGQGGTGANASIEGTFVAWVFDWKKAGVLRPWSSPNSDRPVRIRTIQAVPAVSVQAEPDGAKPTQAKQQVAVSFFNTACPAAVNNRNLCQLRIMLDIDLVRKAGTDWSAQHWASRARLLLDRAQAGLPVIEGPLGDRGDMTLAAGARGAALWRSAGARTQHGAFSSNAFEAQITFSQLMAALQIVGQRVNNQKGELSAQDMKALFGPEWNVPQAWAVAGVNVAQEIHSDRARSASYIGGEVSLLSVGR